MIATPENMLKSLMMIKKAGKPRKGVSTGFPSIDEHMLLNRQYLMLLTGLPSHGKTEFLDAIAVNTAVEHGWNWLYFSPETDKLESHLQKLVAKKTGKRLVSTPDEEIVHAVEWAQDHFAWIDAGDGLFNLDDVIAATEEHIQTGHKVDALVIDPWNELDHSKQTHRDDVYIGQCLTKLRKFHRKYDILTVIVIHPHSVSKDKDGNYPVVHLRDCAGGAMWWNKADYGVCFHRPDVTKDGGHVIIQKVKDRSIGYPGKVFMKYQQGSGRFADQESEEFSLPINKLDSPF